jgi:hypothetical protein
VRVFLSGSAALVALTLALAAAPEPETVVVLPLEVDGELPQKWIDEAQSRMRAGFARSSMSLVEASPGGAVGCRDRACIRGLADTASHVATPRLRVSGERDYTFAIDVASTRTGEVVATVEGECDLCGFEEVGALIEAKAVAAAAALEKLRAAFATVEIGTNPLGATVEVDGVVQGTTPLDLELAPGVHRVRVTKPGFLDQVFEYEAIEGMRKRIDMPLEAEPPPPPDPGIRRSRDMFIAGGVIGVLGLGAVGGGVALLAIDGEPYERDCQADVQGNCRQLYRTANGGIATIAVGAAGTILGITLVALGADARRKAKRRKANVRFLPRSGFAIAF